MITFVQNYEKYVKNIKMKVKETFKKFSRKLLKMYHCESELWGKSAKNWQKKLKTREIHIFAKLT